jgi:hypothetical protein
MKRVRTCGRGCEHYNWLGKSCFYAEGISVRLGKICVYGLKTESSEERGTKEGGLPEIIKILDYVNHKE